MNELQLQLNDLNIQKMKLDKFFTLFLDKFDSKMKSDNPTTPIWKLYKQKGEEYSKLNQQIRNTQYWISKSNV